MTPASGTAKQVGTAPVTVMPKACDLVLWLIPRVNKFPRALRPVLGERTPAASRSERQTSTICSRPARAKANMTDRPVAGRWPKPCVPLLMEVEYEA
jgi:hypothetical protein